MSTLLQTKGSRLAAFALVLLAGVMIASWLAGLATAQQPETRQRGEFTLGRTMATDRGFHTATSLQDGRVLLTGGGNGVSVLVSAETFNPDTDRFALTGPMNVGRLNHRSTLLDSGGVLISGGGNGDDKFFDSTEIYDPDAAAFKASANMSIGRSSHTLTVLQDGRVLIAGGLGDKFVSLSVAEIFDASSGEFQSVGSMNVGRSHHTATLLPDGRVALVGGFGPTGATDSIEVFDPMPGAFVERGRLQVPRGGHTATLLENGQLMVAGGANLAQEAAGETPLGEIELIDINAGTSRVVKQRMIPRTAHTASVLRDGRVLIAGGIGPGESVVGLAQTFDPDDESVTITDFMIIPRAFHTATSLIDGRVLIAGGVASGGVFLSSPESFEYLEDPVPTDSVVSGQTLEPATSSARPPGQEKQTQAPTTTAADNGTGGACSGRADGILLGHIATLVMPLGLLATTRIRRRR